MMNLRSECTFEGQGVDQPRRRLQLPQSLSGGSEIFLVLQCVQVIGIEARCRTGIVHRILGGRRRQPEMGRGRLSDRKTVHALLVSW